jgi:hypothetical protein
MRPPFPTTESVLLLKTSIIRNYCISCPKGQFSTLVGDLTCLGQKFYNDTAQETQWWEAPNQTEPKAHPLANFSNLWEAWKNLTTNIDWWAPRGLYWICGKQAYMVYLAAGLRLVCYAQSGHPSSPFIYGSPIYEDKLSRQSRCFTIWQLER